MTQFCCQAVIHKVTYKKLCFVVYSIRIVIMISLRGVCVQVCYIIIRIVYLEKYRCTYRCKHVALANVEVQAFNYCLPRILL